MACAAPEEPLLVIEVDRVITATDEDPILEAAVVVSGNRIVFVGPRSEMPQSEQARRLAPENATVLPGLIDSHVHYREWMPKLFLYYGVTSVLDTGNQTDWILTQREALRKGEIQGPRLFTTGLALNGVPPEPDAEIRHTIVSSSEEAGRAARYLMEQGVDSIKIHEWLSADLIEVVTQEARQYDKPVLGHLGMAADRAILAGLSCLIHPYGIELATNKDPGVREYILTHMADYQARREYYPYHQLDPAGYPELIQLMVERRVFFNPTFGAQLRGIYPQGAEFDAYDRKVLDEKLKGLPYLDPVLDNFLPFHTRLRSHPVDDAQRETLVEGMEKVTLFMRDFVAAGGKLLAGTDSSRTGITGLRLHRELELWVLNGIPPIEALKAATLYPAQLLNQDADLGTVEEGKLADLLVVRGDPLQDIRTTKEILYVIQDGHILSRELN